MLRSSYERGCADALERLGVKVASIPTARVVPKGSGVRGPVTTGGTANRVMEGVSRVAGPVKKGLGLAALGGAGALAYGLHRQNVEDREKNPLVYAPMTGGYYGQ